MIHGHGKSTLFQGIYVQWYPQNFILNCQNLLVVKNLTNFTWDTRFNLHHQKSSNCHKNLRKSSVARKYIPHSSTLFESF
jgi:hypothetical protein